MNIAHRVSRKTIWAEPSKVTSTRGGESLEMTDVTALTRQQAEGESQVVESDWLAKIEEL